jgi:plasmid stabilization system protein ParE
MANGRPKLAIQWHPNARQAYLESLAYIAAQDQHVADLVALRVEQTLDLIASQPGLGTSVRPSGRRRFAIPKTGHVLEYYVVQTKVKIVRWARQARKA